MLRKSISANYKLMQISHTPILKLAIPALILVLGLAFNPFAVGAQSITLNVLTYNIRLLNPGDAPNTWSARKQKVFSLISAAKPDVFGLQEPVREQVKDIEYAFPDYALVGVGRDDGKEAGEYSPLFYNEHKFKLLSSGTFWLSQTPTIAGSRGWDAACNRVVSWVQLKDYKTGKVFFVFCTHFDHMGEIARRNSANLLLHAVDSLSGNNPVIVLGDFNSKPDSEPYQIITDKSNPNHLLDARENCKKPTGPKYTFTGFKVGAQPGDRIDYIFLKNKIKVLSFRVNNKNDGNYYPSDHLPVSAVLRF
ncbi:MAG: endonuclease/exonuclease/phosphatase family protein [Lentimicrobiaceae bacterium]|jgi:endonuclease/exonuclease/phosphatase family metal-dependent hydrolase